MSDSIECKEIAKEVRKDLKALYPLTKFSVTSDHNKIDIRWEDGAIGKEVEAVAMKYSGRSGYDPNYGDYTKSEKILFRGEMVYTRLIYVFSHRELSESFLNQVLAHCKSKYQVCIDADIRVDRHYFDSSSYRAVEQCMEIARRCHGYASVESQEQALSDKKEAEYKAWKEEKERAEKQLEEDLENGVIVCDLPTEGYVGKNFTLDNGEEWEIIGVQYQKYAYSTGGEWQYEAKNLVNENVTRWTFDSLEFKLYPINPISTKTISEKLFISGIMPTLNKQNCLDEYLDQLKEREFGLTRCKITEIIELSPHDYDRFSQNFLTDFDFLSGKGGSGSEAEFDREVNDFYELTAQERELWHKYEYTKCVAVYAKDREPLLIDPQGYNYARYVGFLEDKTALNSYIYPSITHSYYKPQPPKNILDDAQIIANQFNQPVVIAAYGEGLYATQFLVDRALQIGDVYQYGKESMTALVFIHPEIIPDLRPSPVVEGRRIRHLQLVK